MPSIDGRFPSKRDVKARMRPLHLGIDFLEECLDVSAVGPSIARLNVSTFSSDIALLLNSGGFEGFLLGREPPEGA